MTAKYDLIGNEYDSTRCADPVLVAKIAKHLKIEDGYKYLDIACGSGNYTAALAKTGGRWTGVDQSRVMLDKASVKTDRVNWVEGNADALPFAANSFRSAACTLAIHHFPSLVTVFGEVRRVLLQNFTLFTSTAEQMKGYWLQKYFPEAMKRSWGQMPELSKIENALKKTGLRITNIEPYFVHKGLKDYFLYSGKHRPEIYLEPEIRRGISTFSSLAGKEEIQKGCLELRRDIDSGDIKEVICEYENDLGDYYFIVCE